MEYWVLDIIGISITNPNKKKICIPTKKKLSIVVSINGDSHTKQTTPIQEARGTATKWYHQMKFCIDEVAARKSFLTLVFQLKSKRIWCNKNIGEVQVPIKELLLDTSGSVQNSVNYDIKMPNGKMKGKLEFLYQFGRGNTVNQPVSGYPPGGYALPPPRPPHGYGGYPPQAGVGGYPRMAGEFLGHLGGQVLADILAPVVEDMIQSGFMDGMIDGFNP